jgi:hypothetical protein
MPKVKISEFSSTPANNTDIDSIFIGEGMAPSNVNDAIRELMAQLKDFQTGAAGDSFNGPVGTTTAAAGAFTTLSATGNVTLGDASTDTLNVGNGGLIKDASGNLGLGVTPSAWGSTLRTLEGSFGQSWFYSNTSTNTGLVSNAYNNGTNWIYKTTNAAVLYDQGVGGANHRWFNAPSGTAGNAITFTQAMTLDASGRLQIGGTTAYDSAMLSVTTPSQTWSVIADGGTTSNKSRGGFYHPSANVFALNVDGASGVLAFTQNSTERARIDSSGDFIVGVNGSGRAIIAKQDSDGEGWNGAATALYVGKVNGTGRSINAGGTINASGADYAEYMTKAGDFTVAKGDVVGINAQGKLTNVFADAISFVVKSTDPSYVGGDTWGSKESLGLTRPNDDATDEEKATYADAFESARQLVDRIAFAGQVPVNVLGATAGQYIVPVNDNGEIKGQAISNPTFEQYQSSVGKVIAIEADGRARIIVKVA